MSGDPLDLDAIEARLVLATPGPWRYDPTKVNSVSWEESVFAGEHGPGAMTIASTGPCDDTQSMCDAEFIAHAREDVPALIAEVRLLRDRDAETRRLIEAWVRHGRAVPADVTTYDRELVNMELLAIVERP